MDGLPAWANFTIAFVFANLMFHLIYMMDRQAKSEGYLFAKPPTLKSRIFAALIGLALGGFYFMVWLIGSDINNHESAIIIIGSAALLGYSIGLDRPLQIVQKAYYNYHPVNPKPKKIMNINEKTFEEIFTKVQAGGRFLVFGYCISPFIGTLDYESPIYFIEANENPIRTSLKYSILTALLGWESLFGLFHAFRCLMINFRGGIDVTPQIMEWLTRQVNKLKQAAGAGDTISVATDSKEQNEESSMQTEMKTKK